MELNIDVEIEAITFREKLTKASMEDMGNAEFINTIPLAKRARET